MSILSGIFEKRQVIASGNLTDTSDFWYGVAGMQSTAGLSVNKVNAMRVAMVATCIFLRANTIAQFPLKLKRRVGDETTDATDHRLYELVKLQPNPEMTSFSWRQSGQASIDTCGSEYNYIERSRAGIKAIWPIPFESVEMRRANREDINKFRLNKSERIVYDVRLSGTKPVTIPARDILHHIGFSTDGRKGQSVISLAVNTIGNRLSLDEFQGSWMRKGMHISGVFEHPEALGKNKEAFVDALKKRYGGSAKAGAPLVLEHGMKYNQIKVSLADQQFIEQAELNALEIARIFQVPPSRVGIPGVNESNSSLEQENLRFLDTTIMPIVVAREQAMNVKLLTADERKAGYFFKHNFDSLLRPDAETRAKVDKAHWEMGKPYNEIRKQDDLNPIPGGDKSYVPMNFMDANAEPDPEPTDQRSVERRSIAARDRIAKRWEPIIRNVSEKLVNFETLAVERQAKKHIKERAENDFLVWAESFYKDFRGRIKSDLGAVMREYMLSVAVEVRKEVGSNIADSELEKDIDKYIDGMADQWAGSSEGQLRKLIEEEDYTAVTERVAEWRENMVDKITTRQSTQGPNAIATTIFFALGLTSRWMTRGAKTCSYCRSLDGKTIKRDGQFVGVEGLDPGTGEPIFKPKGITKFPPLHKGCDCYVVAT